MANEESGSPALAQMIHQTHLFTWLVRLAGEVLAILVLVPALFFFVGVMAGFPALAGVGGVVSVVWVLVRLMVVQAPSPTDDVVKLLDAEG